MKVYVSGALAAAKNLAVSVEFYEWLAIALNEAGFQAHLPHKSNHPSGHSERLDTTVYNDDLDALLSCDVCLARLDEPSLGVGAEIAIALERRIPVFVYYKADSHVSRFVTGLVRRAGEPNAVITYTDRSQLVAQVTRRLTTLSTIHR